jgi:uncharacterized protein (TIGR02453 family)
MTAHFSPRLFRFLRDLEANNDRAWFQANKARYERDVKEPALQFISDFGPKLRKISPHFNADPRPVGGSLFRIHRDTRFSKDKSPYKTHTGLHFRHESAANAYAPGFYLHLEPGSVFVGLGVWHPDSATTKMIRDAIVADPAAWTRLRGRKGFAGRFELQGDSLKRPPRGFDPEHRHIEDLKRKDFIGVAKLTQKEVCSPDFLHRFAGRCEEGAPLVRFICGAVDLPF